MLTMDLDESVKASLGTLRQELAQERQDVVNILAAIREEQTAATKNRAIMELKYSSTYLNLRKKEAHLTAQHQYAEAAKLRNEARRVQTGEDVLHNAELNRRLRALDEKLQRSEQAELLKLQKNQFEFLCQAAYEGDFPLTAWQRARQAAASGGR